MEEKLKATEKQLQQTRQSFRDSRDRIRRYEGTINNLENTILELDQTVKNLRNEQGQMSDLQSSLKERLRTTEEKLRRMKLESNQLRRQKKDALRVLQQLQQRIASLEDQRTREIERLERKVNRLRLAKSERLERLKKENKRLRKRLTNISNAQARIEGQNVVITLDARILFDPGKARLKKPAQRTLDSLATVFDEYDDRFIGVEGHTDTIPIRVNNFSSNWHLSAVRAVTVVEYLIDKHGIDPRRLGASGYGEYRPLYPNRTPEERSLNRRVEIVLYPASLKLRTHSNV